MSAQTSRNASKLELSLILSRVMKVARLDRDEILLLKENREATGQSVAVLVLTALAVALGTTLRLEIVNSNVSAYGIIVGSLAGIVTGCFASFVWSGTIFLVGTRLFQGKTGFWELARPIFFASSPGVLFLLVSIPVQSVNHIVGLAYVIVISIFASSWVVVSQAFVLKQVMGFSPARTFLTFVVGFLILLSVWLQFG